MEPLMTFEALAVAALALLPGAVCTWAYEQEAGRWGARAVDRVLRYIGTSAVFVIVLLPALYEAYRTLVVSGRVAEGRPLPWWVWLGSVVYVAVPFALGRTLGIAVKRGRRWTRWVVGPAPAPRAWDHLFARDELNGWLRLKLTDGTWIFGAWSVAEGSGIRSYAAGYPEEQDLYLADTAEVDGDGNALVVGDVTSAPRLRGVGLLV